MSQLTDTVTIRLMEDGLAILQANRGLRDETVEFVKSLIEYRPKSVTESEKVHYLTAMAGVTLGLGLAKDNQAIEDKGGFPALAEQLLGPEAAEILRRGEDSQ